MALKLQVIYGVVYTIIPILNHVKKFFLRINLKFLALIHHNKACWMSDDLYTLTRPFGKLLQVLPLFLIVVSDEKSILAPDQKVV
jgi:hypothetical protein